LKVTLKSPDPQNTDLCITSPFYPQLPQPGDIEIRYDGIGLEDENDPHSDARACFASLASLAGTEWWLYYDDGLGCPTNPYRPDKFKLQKPGGKETETGSDGHLANAAKETMISCSLFYL
jgi:hypothetical protein